MRTLAFAVLVVAALAACGKEYKYLGDECRATSECAAGLVCDLGQDPAVCAEFTTPEPDAAPVPVDGPPSLVDGPPAPIDGPPAPIDGPPPPDAAPPPDATLIDATAVDAL